MQFYEKIKSLETLFKNATAQIKELEAELQKNSQSYIETQTEQAKQQLATQAESELNARAEAIQAEALNKVTELFNASVDLTQQVAERIDINAISAQLVSEFSAQNKETLRLYLQDAFKEVMKEQKASMEKMAQEAIAQARQFLKVEKAKLLAKMGDELQHLLKENATTLTARLDLSPLHNLAELKATNLLKSEKFLATLKGRVVKVVDEYVKEIASTEQISESIKQEAREMVKRELASDELIHMRYESALRLESLKLYAIQEQIEKVIKQEAHAFNYKKIIESAQAKTTTNKTLLAV